LPCFLWNLDLSGLHPGEQAQLPSGFYYEHPHLHHVDSFDHDGGSEVPCLQPSLISEAHLKKQPEFQQSRKILPVPESSRKANAHGSHQGER